MYKSLCHTRFATRFFQIKRAIDNNPAAQAVVALPEYCRRYEEQIVDGRSRGNEDDAEDNPVFELDPGNRTLSEILEENKQHITKPAFWRSLKDPVAVLDPAINLLKLADSDRLMAGKIYGKMHEVHKHLEQAEENNSSIHGIADLWYARWQYHHHPIYCAAYVLHPDNNQSNPLSDPYIKSELLTVLKRNFPIASERNAVHAAIVRYLSRQGHFCTLDEYGEERAVWSTEFITTFSPWQWWQNFIDVEPVLTRFAMRILQLGIAFSACERAFSKWTFMVTKYRTRLALSRQMKSIYCFHNSRMLKNNSGEDKFYRSDSDDDEGTD